MNQPRVSGVTVVIETNKRYDEFMFFLIATLAVFWLACKKFPSDKGWD